MIRSIAAVVALSALFGAASAQQDFEFWPGANYDPGVPTFEDVLGYAPGERITWVHDVRRSTLR